MPFAFGISLGLSFALFHGVEQPLRGRIRRALGGGANALSARAGERPARASCRPSSSAGFTYSRARRSDAIRRHASGRSASRLSSAPSRRTRIASMRSRSRMTAQRAVAVHHLAVVAPHRRRIRIAAAVHVEARRARLEQEQAAPREVFAEHARLRARLREQRAHRPGRQRAVARPARRATRRSRASRDAHAPIAADASTTPRRRERRRRRCERRTRAARGDQRASATGATTSANTGTLRTAVNSSDGERRGDEPVAQRRAHAERARGPAAAAARPARTPRSRCSSRPTR